jgi:hypothetical protein
MPIIQLEHSLIYHAALTLMSLPFDGDVGSRGSFVWMMTA